jgi:Ser/Thr protein kinase RdoA (MazF antagonist)
MKDYYALTALGRGRRLRKMAIEALKQYDLEISRLRLLTNETNGIFRVDTIDHRRLVLRITDPIGCHALEEIQSEVMWLDSLSQDTELQVPRPLRAEDGSWVVTAQTEGVPEARYCVLFSWLPGVDLAQRLTAANMYLLGKATALLHLHAKAFHPPDGFQVRALDKVFPYSDTDFSYVEPVVLFDEVRAHFFPPEGREVFLRAKAQIEATLDDLYRDPSGMRVTHNDLHQWNVKIYRGAIAILDFEDLAWGFPIQDIGTTFNYLQALKNKSELIKGYRQGYTELLAWPEQYPGQVECLIAARGMMLVNYLLCSRNREDQEFAPEYIARMVERFKKLLPA